MSQKTPAGAWPSGDIDQLLRQLAEALPRCGAGALVAAGVDPGITGALGVLLLDVSPGATVARGGGVLDLPTLIQVKIETGRPKDKAAVPVLIAALEAQKKPAG